MAISYKIQAKENSNQLYTKEKCNRSILGSKSLSVCTSKIILEAPATDTRFSLLDTFKYSLFVILEKQNKIKKTLKAVEYMFSCILFPAWI